MFTSKPRKLPYPLDRAVELTVLTPEGEEVCGLPAFPEDSDERITVLFRLSLNEFVALASAVDAGIDPAFAEDAQKVWWIWAFSVMCASFCEEMAACLTAENLAVVEALANLIANNATIRGAISSAISELGSGIPGQPLTEEQSAQDFLPENVKDEFGDCDLDALWGACLFLVQSGNRAITDFLEIVEEQTNALETSAIVVGAIPAAGDFAEAGLEFADQLLENISEGYAAAYTTEYEEQLACEIFCAAQAADCTLSADTLVDIMAARLSFTNPGDFGDVMSGIGGAIYPGVNIPDSAFYIFFTAIKFGQKFLDTVGIRPLTALMSLGADQLASDNWTVLCDCPEPPGSRVPVIDTAGSCAGGGYGGTDIVDEGGEFWTITASFATSDYRVIIKDAADQEFIISDMSYPDMVDASCHVWNAVVAGCEVDCSSPPATTAEMTQYGWTWNGIYRVTFKMTAP